MSLPIFAPDSQLHVRNLLTGQAGQGHVDSFQIWWVKIGPTVGAAAQLPIAGTYMLPPHMSFGNGPSSDPLSFFEKDQTGYPLVNIQKTMENYHF